MTKSTHCLSLRLRLLDWCPVWTMVDSQSAWYPNSVCTEAFIIVTFSGYQGWQTMVSHCVPLNYYNNILFWLLGIHILCITQVKWTCIVHINNCYIFVMTTSSAVHYSTVHLILAYEITVKYKFTVFSLLRIHSIYPWNTNSQVFQRTRYKFTDISLRGH